LSAVDPIHFFLQSKKLLSTSTTFPIDPELVHILTLFGK